MESAIEVKFSQTAERRLFKKSLLKSLSPPTPNQNQSERNVIYFFINS